MVHAQVQDVFLLCQFHQTDTDQDVLCQIEWPVQRLFRQGLLRLFSFLLPKSGQIVIRQRKRLHRQYPLHRLPVLFAHEHRAQRLVTGQNLIQRTLQRLPVQLALHTQHGRDVIRSPQLFELLQKPQPLLRP